MPGYAAHALTVQLDATPPQVALGQQSTLKWSSSGARWCWAHGGWGGSRSLNGSAESPRLWTKRWFAVTCSDGKQQVTDGVTVTVGAGTAGLQVDLTASPAAVDPGRTATLRWTSSGAKYCWAHDGWGGSRSLNGSADSPRLWKPRSFAVTCSDGSRQATDSVSVAVAGAGGGGTELSVKIDADPRTVAKGGSSTLRWTSQAADSCAASGGWSGGRSASGSFNTGALSQSTSYKITCKRGAETAIASVTVAVNTVPVVRWQAPTQNVDGSPLMDLAGYKFYWGTQSRKYQGSARVNNPDLTQHQPDYLPSGRYFVAVTAVDGEGNESDFSNEIRIDVP